MVEIDVELEYQKRIEKMSPAEKIACFAAMFAWSRQQMARQVRRANPACSDEQLKWEVSLKLYEHEPEVVKLIEEHLRHVHR